MMRSTLLTTTLVAIASLCAPAFAAGDPAEGQKLAEQYCSRCHDVGPDGAFKEFPPTFKAISVYRSDHQIYARIVFPPTHSAMSQAELYLLNRQQIDDLIAYIVSLEN